MKSYDKISESIFENKEDYIKKQKARRKIILCTVVPLLCLCIVIAAIFGFLKNDSNLKVNSDNKNTESIFETEQANIDSLDKLNFYAVKTAIAQKESGLVSESDVKVETLADNRNFGILNLANSTATDINPNSTFTITMYSYFTMSLNDPKGFLAQKLGGTGVVEVVITRNNFNNMITFKKGERYYSCLQTVQTERAMSFSSHKYVSGFKLVENFDQENYEFTVYFDGDRVVGMNCVRFIGNGDYKYVADDIRVNDNFCFVIFQKQSFTAKELEKLFSNNTPFADDGIVLNDGTILYGEASVTDNDVAFKNSQGKAVLTNSDIKKVSAMHNDEFGFCIRLELDDGKKVADETKLDFYLNDLKVRRLTLNTDGAVVYITELSNKSRMSDIFYKLTASDKSNRIGKIVFYEDFLREAAKKINLKNYDVLVEDHSEKFGNGLKIVDYTYEHKGNKSIKYKASNYDVTLDGITVTLPIKVSDFLEKGFTLTDKSFDNEILQGSAVFTTPSGNVVDTYIMDFYGNSRNFYDCYITQFLIMCYGKSFKYEEGISETRPDFEMLEGINKDSTFDDIVSRLGEPQKIIIMTTDNQPINYKDCHFQLYYNVYTPALPNGKLVFNIGSVINGDEPPDFLLNVSFHLQ